MKLEIVIQTRISRSMLKEIKRIADTQGLLVATWLRQLLIRELNNNKPTLKNYYETNINNKNL